MTFLSRPRPRIIAQVEPYVDVMGLDLAVEFLLTFGGAELAIAKDPREHSQLVALVGLEKARALAERAHLLQRRIPLAKRWLAAVLCWRGHSVAGIARRLRISDVTVRRYLREGRLA